MRGAATICIALALLAAGSLRADIPEKPPALKNNPFARPPSEVLRDSPVEPGRTIGTTLTPQVRATMIGSVNKLANVDGRILKRGDEVDGYLLVAIHEQYAVFRRSGEDIKVYVKPLAEDDE